MSADDAIYRVQFKTEQHYYDLYVRHVFPADMGVLSAWKASSFTKKRKC